MINSSRNTDVEKERYLQLVNEFLCPMFPGTTVLVKSFSAPKSKNLVSVYENGTQLKIKPFAESSYVFFAWRSQPFSQQERNTISVFNEVMSILLDQWDEALWRYQANALLPKFVAKATTSNWKVLTYVITTMLEWSEQTYEGQRIAFSVGVGGRAKFEAPEFSKVVRHDFIKVVSNGFDTMMQCGLDGKVIGHVTFSSIDSQKLLAPVRYGALANWSADGRPVVCLNRNGEVLIFIDKELRFAKRRGLWRHFAHETNIKQMALGSTKPFELTIRKAVYLTALDVAFSRSGGCIGLVKNGKQALMRSDKESDKGVVTVRDNLQNSSDIKSSTIRALLGDSRDFTSVDRRLRQELIALDGATVLHHNGQIQAVGSILRVPGGSTGGGRTAAAKCLSSFGMGIKISNDGYVEIYAPGDPKPRIAFG